MVTDSTGVPRFESYKVKADNNGNYRGDFVDGTPTPALAGSGYAPATGLITIVVRASDIGVTAAGQSITSLLADLLEARRRPLAASRPDARQRHRRRLRADRPGLAMRSESRPGPRPHCIVHRPAQEPQHPLRRLPLLRSRRDSTDPQLRDTITKYVFDFGDGSAPVATTSPTIDHQYQSGGQYGATLRVQDSRGKASDSTGVKQICDKCMK